MDIVYFEQINNELKPFMIKQGFSLSEDGVFKSLEKQFKVEYDDATSQFVLNYSDVVAGEPNGFTQLAAWYFDEKNHGPNDTKVIAEDFVNIISAKLGIVIENKVSSEQVAMPTKAVEGQTPSVDAFTNKFLASFPQYKDTYKEHVAKYGKFLPVEFYKTYGVEKCREVIDGGNKKAIGKLFTTLGDMYVEGDTTVGNLICGVLIAGTFKDDVALFEKIAEEHLANNIYLKQAGRAILIEYKANKKLQAILK